MKQLISFRDVILLSCSGVRASGAVPVRVIVSDLRWKQRARISTRLAVASFFLENEAVSAVSRKEIAPRNFPRSHCARFPPCGHFLP